MKSYKFYLNAAHHFLTLKDYEKLAGQEKDYCHLSSFIFSWIALESYVNMVSDSLSKGTRLKAHEKAFLLEQELKVDDCGVFKEINIHPSTTRKILFLINYFTKIDVKTFKQLKLWMTLTNFEELRNKIIHYKQKEDVNLTRKQVMDSIENTEQLINYLNKEVFRKS
ncbi:MAG: hypothetical protein ABIG69_18535 [Bacteroidota bacterium]|nr:hypothetical protein [Candidatus Micrarchaeota archaeon]MBU1165595.1 hypothetical protein [Candidatus Micrarchaeota archaeon]MBU1886203.1 hypothetical protein [Candidatus Micrarchaeota archaeon]